MVHIIGSKPIGESASSGAAQIIDVTVQNFEQDVIRQSINTPVLLDLWADWCEPCKELGPRLDAVARKANGAFVLAKMDVEANQEIAGMLGVKSIPTVILFSGGRPVDAFTGVQTESEIEKFITKYVEFAPAGAAAAEQTPTSELAKGDIASARKLNTDGDPVMGLRLAALSGSWDELDKLLEVEPDGSGEYVEPARTIQAAAKNPESPAGKVITGLNESNLAQIMDSLLESKDESVRPILLAFLSLLGRGDFADDYRTRLARQVFS